METLRQIITSLLLVLITTAGAQAIDLTPDPVGYWRFKNTSKTVKVVIIGGSISASPVNYGMYLGASCKNAEFKNKARIAFGSARLHGRFKRQVIRNRRVKLDDERFEFWLMYNGGMNGVGYPEGTIDAMTSTFALAHRHKMKVISLGLTPWGSRTDRKWRAFKGLGRLDKTQKIVDFALGKLTREQALGKRAKGRLEWDPAELPDLSVNLYKGALRLHDAPLRDKEKLLKIYKRSRKLQERYPNAENAIERATTVPRWFLRPELRGYDNVHPNRKGQKIMAVEICPVLPQNWGCDCERVQNMVWKYGKGLVVPKP
jgi:lysophospholipase L1-like esterase